MPSVGRCWVLTLLALAACRSVPVAPAGRDAGVVGIAVAIRGPLGFPTYTADTVYFRRPCPAAEPCDTPLHASNHATDGRVYWLDAPPGEYVAVAASFTVLQDPQLYVTYFPEELVRRTAVRAEDGSLAYAGSYVLRTRIGICYAEADVAQVETAHGLGLPLTGCGLVDQLVGMLVTNTKTLSYRGELERAVRDDADRAAFLERAREDLAPGGWRLGPR